MVCDEDRRSGVEVFGAFDNFETDACGEAHEGAEGAARNPLGGAVAVEC